MWMIILICIFNPVWSKLKSQKSSERWQPDTEEEYEDSSGNVVNKKTYEDLKRQGLL
jgi:splicing factor 3A subunit 3